MFSRASELQSKPQGAGAPSGPDAYALRALLSLKGDAEGIDLFLRGLNGLEEGAPLAEVLSGSYRADPRLKADMRSQLIAAISALGPAQADKPAIKALVHGLASAISPMDLERTPHLQENLAIALAHDNYPRDPAKAASEAERLQALFKRSDIAQSVFSEPLDRQLIMHKVIKDPRVTAQLPNGPGNDWSRNKIVCEDAAKVILFGQRTVLELDPAEMKLVEQLAGILATTGGQQILHVGESARESKSRGARGPCRPSGDRCRDVPTVEERMASRTGTRHCQHVPVR